MASPTLSNPSSDAEPRRFDEPAGLSVKQLFVMLLTPLASLRLTVALFLLAIFIVFAGTVAQIDKDIWQVVHEYFRTAVARIELQIFFPRSIEVPGAFYFPGGWLIGALMFANLFAAHLLRFKAQAKGTRLIGGAALIALGVAMTWLVVVSGSNKDGLEGVPYISWEALWKCCLLGLAGLTFLAAFWTYKLPPGRKLERFGLGGVALSVGVLLAWLIAGGEEVALSGPSMRILWQLIKGGLASAVLLVGCVLVFRKRGGIVLLHSGVGLMMLSELLVGTMAIEGQMSIREGETVNYVFDIRAVELAVVDTSGDKEDDVVVVPQALWEHIQRKNADSKLPALIRDEQLPFDIEVLEFLQNSKLTRAKAGDENLATVGIGRDWIAQSLKPSSGTDTDSAVDESAMYLKLKDKGGKDLGTRLLSLSFDRRGMPEKVQVGEKTYDLTLRFQRTYKPYSMHLMDVKFDKYMGTTMAKNYSSDLRLVDKSRNEDREVKIWMNNPLRYAGETFYQSQFHVDPQTGAELTGLQVVTNTGWMIPYVACMIVATGLLAHFGLVLVRFLNRRAQEQSLPAQAGRKRRVREAPDSTGRWAPVVVVALAAVFLASLARLPKTPDAKMDLYAFGKLPVMYQGRLKPLDTLARNSLRIISNKETFRDAKNVRQPAIRWLLDVATDPFEAAKHKVVRIENLDVLSTLGLKPREGFRYSVDEFRDKMGTFEEQAQLAHGLPADELSTYQKKILELDNRLRLYTLLLASFDLPRIRPEKAPDDVLAAMQRQRQMQLNMQLPLVVPPEKKGGEWDPYAMAWTKGWAQVNLMRQEANPATVELNTILVHYAKGDVAAFNDEVAKYQAHLVKSPPTEYDAGKIRFESFFNHAAPFIWCAWLYVVGFVLTSLSWLGWSRPLNRSAFWLMALVWCVHTAALIGRIYISGRPPVTNLYSSAIFIGWGAVFVGLALEVVFKLGVGNVIASKAGYSTLLIAYSLAGDGDTLIVLQAVLDTQFWLATHVTTITMGYATTYVAGLLGIIYILADWRSNRWTSDNSKSVARMIYGIVCFALYFSFVGTVLGGLWADDSWGRFWGWDPKENGALIIVLWNALVLHARWGGLVKDHGLAVLAVLGNIAVSWSWFGVNELGAGLHSYGFTEGVTLALCLVVAGHLAIAGLGVVQSLTRRSKPILAAEVA